MEPIHEVVTLSKKVEMYEDTLNYIAGNSRLTVDTLQEARDVANLVLEEANE